MDKSGNDLPTPNLRRTSHKSSISWADRAATDDGLKDGSPKEDHSESKPKDDLGKEIGLFYGGSLVMNTIIGPGIFGTPKAVVAGTGSVGMSLVIWALTGFFSTCAALCFAELRESVQREGVEYAYITEAFGSIFGFVYTVMRVGAAEPIATAVFALIFTDYVSDAVYDDCGISALFVKSLAVLTVLTMFLMNVLSTKLSENFQKLSMAGKLAALSLVIGVGIYNLIQGRVSQIQKGFTGSKVSATSLSFACYNGFWAYGGWSNVNHVTSGIKKPPRNVPRVVKTVIPLVLVIYLLTVVSYFTVMSTDDMLDSTAIGLTWVQLALPQARPVIYVGVGLTALGSLNATFLSAGRLSGVAAKNGQMPDVVSWVHVRSKTPVVASALRCLIAIGAVLLADGQRLLRFYIFTVWFFHGASILALLILRFKNKKKKRPYKVDLWIPVFVVTGVAFFLTAPFLQEPEPEIVAAACLLLISALCYYPVTWFKSRTIVSIPDAVVIYLQLLLRIAPKRDLRRERRSFQRQLNLLANNSFIITPTLQPSPAVIRRFSRRMSSAQFSQGSPVLVRKFLDDRLVTIGQKLRGGSLSQLELGLRKRTSSVWSFGMNNKPSPALIRTRAVRPFRSHSHPSIVRLQPPSEHPAPGHLEITLAQDPKGDNTHIGLTSEHPRGASIHPRNLTRSTSTSSPIPEEDPGSDQPVQPAAAHALEPRDDDKSNTDVHTLTDPNMEVLADFQSDGGGEYEILAHRDDIRKQSLNVFRDSDDKIPSSTSDSDSSTSSTSSNKMRPTLMSLFGVYSSDSEMSTEEEENDDEEETVRSFVLELDSSDNEDEGLTIINNINERYTQEYVNEGFVFQDDVFIESSHPETQQSRL